MLAITDLVDQLRDQDQAETFERIGGNTVGDVRRFFGLCQRCGELPPDRSRIMCRECWEEYERTMEQQYEYYERYSDQKQEPLCDSPTY